MSPQDYEHFCELLKARSGIDLGPDKAYLLESRLGSVAGTAGHASVAALLRALRTAPEEKVVEAAVDAMTTNETFFFRDNTPFDALRKHVLPELAKSRAGQPVRIWSAACSTGQEPYSLAMVLREEAPRYPGLKVDILGSDLSERVLQKARSGVYSQFEIQRGLPIQLLMRYFEETTGGFRAKPELREMVRWRRQNLLSSLKLMGQFDVVFLRNVLIYFDRATKARVLEEVASVTAPGGYLVLGAAETVLGLTTTYQSVPGFGGLYQKSAAAAQERPPSFVRAASGG